MTYAITASLATLLTPPPEVPTACLAHSRGNFVTDNFGNTIYR
jgi:hypothetical protein